MFFEIDFNTCYESKPCRHCVMIVDENGEHIEKHLYAPQIVDIVVRHKVPISLYNFKHFEYCFSTPEHYALLNELVDKDKNKTENKVIETHNLRMFKYKHFNPEITHSKRQYRRNTGELKHIIQTDKLNNHQFLVSLETFRQKINVSNNFLLDVFCVRNGEKVYPNKLTLKYQSIEMTFYGHCMKSHIDQYNDLFHQPLYLDSNVEISTDEEVDSVYCKIMSFNCKQEIPKFKHYWSRNETPVVFHEEIQELSEVSGYFNALYIHHPNFENLEAISFVNKDRTFLDRVDICLLKKENNLLYIPLGFGEMSGRCFSSTENNQIIFHTKSIMNFEKYTVYGEKLGVVRGI